MPQDGLRPEYGGDLFVGEVDGVGFEGGCGSGWEVSGCCVGGWDSDADAWWDEHDVPFGISPLRYAVGGCGMALPIR